MDLEKVGISLVVLWSSKEGKVFIKLQKRAMPPDQGKYEFPGGKIESKETPRWAAQRELAEETGLQFSLEQFQLWKIYYFQKYDKNLLFYIFLLELPQDFYHADLCSHDLEKDFSSYQIIEGSRVMWNDLKKYFYP